LLSHDAIVPAAHRSRHSGLTGVLNTILKKEGGFNFDSQHPRLRIEVESAVRHYGCFFFPKTALNVVPVIIMQRQIEITEITT
jgi:hypothetical protein